MASSDFRNAIPDTVLDEIRVSHLLLDEISSAGVALKGHGERYRSLCPFEGKTRGDLDFSVYRSARGWRYRCYAGKCNETGDVIEWVMTRDGLSFPDAVRWCADRLGIEIPRTAAPLERETRPEDEARETALAVLHEISVATARSMLPGESAFPGAESLVEIGELGFVPDREKVEARMTALGVRAAALSDLGITQALRSGLKGWVLWAVARPNSEEWIGARPLDEAMPPIGTAPTRQSTWVVPAVRGRTSGERIRPTWLGITATPALYARLRGIGEHRIALAPTAPERAPFQPRQEPVLLLSPDPAGRAAAWNCALELLRTFPLLRAAEVPTDADRDTLDVLVQESGSVLDWQVRILAERGAFDTSEGRSTATARLGRLATALPEGSLERLAYEAEIHAWTGIEIEVHAPPPTCTQRA